MVNSSSISETDSDGASSDRASLRFAPIESLSRGVTPRVVVFSLMLAALFGYLIPIIDFKLTNSYLGASHLPAGAVGALLFLLLIVNPLLRLISRGVALSRNETLTVYITCLFSCLVPGRGGENFWITNVLASFYLSTHENKWFETLAPYIKPWVSPAITPSGQYNRAVVEGWYTASGTIPWQAWLVPFCTWAIFVFAIYAMLACLAVMLRGQWAEKEALAFPLLKLPVEMTADIDNTNQRGTFDKFFHSRMMWVGFVLVFAAQALNGINNYFPDMPRVSMQISSAGLFTESPWTLLYPSTFMVYPIAIGLTYFLTREVSFSLWFFYWLMKFQILLAYAMGFSPDAMASPSWTRGWAKSFIAYQQIGAYIAYLALIFWMGRQHYLHVARRAFGREKSTPDEHGEALSYPVAFWGFVASFVVCVAWTTAAGVRLDIALVLWLTYLMLALILTRVVAEGGLLFVQSGWAPLGPIAYLTGAGPGTWLSSSSAVPASFVQGGLMTDMRGFLLPSFVQSFKLAKDEGISARPLLKLISACIVVAMIVGWWNILRLGYRDVGGLQLEKQWARGNVATLPAQNALEILKNPPGFSFSNWSWLAVGALTTYGMMWARSRWLWFPLHPLGLIMCWPTAMYSLWFSIFIGWGLKSLIFKYGGSDTYRNLMPFFLGVILGDVASMLFWLALDGWQGVQGHMLMQ